MKTSRSLKSSNLPWLVSLVVLDILVLAVFVWCMVIPFARWLSSSSRQTYRG